MTDATSLRAAVAWSNGRIAEQYRREIRQRFEVENAVV